MSYITKFAEGFMKLFQAGGDNFVGWMTSIVPVVLMLLVAMNALIALLGEEKVNKLARISAKNPLSRYMILPFISALCFMDSISVLEPRGGSYFGLRPQSYADEKKL